MTVISIHDDQMAEDLGFAGAPIEGPTHFSQFVPLLHEVFGDDWFVRGCISAHYQNMVVEGEEVRAMVERSPTDGVVRIAAEKRDGTPVLMGTASVGPDYGTTELEQRMERLRPTEQLVILADLWVGQKGAGNPGKSAWTWISTWVICILFPTPRATENNRKSPLLRQYLALG